MTVYFQYWKSQELEENTKVNFDWRYDCIFPGGLDRLKLL